MGTAAFGPRCLRIASDEERTSRILRIIAGVTTSPRNFVLGLLGILWVLFFLVVTLGAVERWGLLAGLAVAVVWVLLERTVVKGVGRWRGHGPDSA